jgi:hypothetical protein
MKPTPLPPNPRLLDHVEHALQWLFCWLIVDIPGHPMISLTLKEEGKPKG